MSRQHKPYQTRPHRVACWKSPRSLWRAELDRVSGNWRAMELHRLLVRGTRRLARWTPQSIYALVWLLSIEGNYLHGLRRRPVDPIDGNGALIPGNTAVLIPLAFGRDVRGVERFRPLLTISSGRKLDRLGRPKRYHGFDEVDPDGIPTGQLMSKATVIHQDQVVTAPLESGLPLDMMAALSLRAPCVADMVHQTLQQLLAHAVPHDHRGFVPMAQAIDAGYAGIAAYLRRNIEGPLYALAGPGISGAIFLMLLQFYGFKGIYLTDNVTWGSYMNRHHDVTWLHPKDFGYLRTRKWVSKFNEKVRALTGGYKPLALNDNFGGHYRQALIAAADSSAVYSCAGWWEYAMSGRLEQFNPANLCARRINFINAHGAAPELCRAVPTLYFGRAIPGLPIVRYQWHEMVTALENMERGGDRGAGVVQVHSDRALRRILPVKHHSVYLTRDR